MQLTTMPTQAHSDRPRRNFHHTYFYRYYVAWSGIWQADRFTQAPDAYSSESSTPQETFHV